MNRKCLKIFLIALAVISIAVKTFPVYAEEVSSPGYAAPDKVFSADVQAICVFR
ncbi:MAG: hypothetical protein KAR21_25045 [Spirochaetales bacterium]|nr:hypothetical protein [Spirochaetales bacterium]